MASASKRSCTRYGCRTCPGLVRGQRVRIQHPRRVHKPGANRSLGCKPQNGQIAPVSNWRPLQHTRYLTGSCRNFKPSFFNSAPELRPCLTLRQFHAPVTRILRTRETGRPLIEQEATAALGGRACRMDDTHQSLTDHEAVVEIVGACPVRHRIKPASGASKSAPEKLRKRGPDGDGFRDGGPGAELSESILKITILAWPQRRHAPLTRR